MLGVDRGIILECQEVVSIGSVGRSGRRGEPWESLACI